MGNVARINLRIVQGGSEDIVFRYGSGPKTYKDVTAVTDLAPLTITALSHGIVADAWPVALSDFGGMPELGSCGMYRAVIVDVDTLRIDAVNAKQFGTYTTGGTVMYSPPVDLTGYTARMQIRPVIDSGSVLDEFTTEDVRLPTTGIVIDTTDKRIDLLIADEVTEAYDWLSAVYSLELITAGGLVTPLAQGAIAVIREVTRD